MFQKRVTKYDPKKRNAQGYYLWDEWTEYSDIGKIYQGREVTITEYLDVEERYLAYIEAFLWALNVKEMAIYCLWIDKNNNDALKRLGGEPLLPFEKIQEGGVLEGDEVLACVRSVLRGQIWCKLLGAKGSYLHFGYDFYMYLGCDEPSLLIEPDIPGLYVENFCSPYTQK